MCVLEREDLCGDRVEVLSQSSTAGGSTSSKGKARKLRRQRIQQESLAQLPTARAIATQTEEDVSWERNLAAQCLEDKLRTARHEITKMKLKLMVARGKVAALKCARIEDVSSESDVSEASELLACFSEDGKSESDSEESESEVSSYAANPLIYLTDDDADALRLVSRLHLHLVDECDL